MGFDEEDEPKDWEIEEEVPSEKLERKWEKEDAAGRTTVVCPQCKKHVPAEPLNCIFCGAQVFRDSGFLGKLLKWFQGK